MDASKTLLFMFFGFLVFVLLLGLGDFSNGEVPNSDPNLTECSDWVNCNPNPPSYNGICCRTCYFKDLGHREWDCAVHSEKDAGFSQETKNSMKKRALYECENPDIRELLIMELNSPGE